MSVDLTLLPFDGDTFSHTVLQVDNSKQLWEILSQLKSMQVPDGFNSYLSYQNKQESASYGLTTEDAYGAAVNYVEVESLTKLSKHHLIVNSWQNRAVWAYLRELPKRTKVALFWS